jgi:hypothetical protein
LASNHRKIYLINPQFQLKFSLYVCLLIFLSSIIYPITIFELLSRFLEFANTNVHKLPEFNSLTINLEEKRKSLIIVLALWQLGFIGLAFVVNIFLTHKVAGPLFKLKKFFQAIMDGQDNGKLYFRNGDYFPDLAESYNGAMEKIKEDHKNDFVYISEVSAYLKNLNQVVPNDKKVVLQEVIKKLGEIQDEFHKDEDIDKDEGNR